MTQANSIKAFETITTEASKMVALAHKQEVERQLKAAWRAGYNFLYVVEDTSHDEDLMVTRKAAFIPADSPEHKFKEFRSTRYDLRRGSMGEQAWDYLMEMT